MSQLKIKPIRVLGRHIKTVISTYIYMLACISLCSTMCWSQSSAQDKIEDESSLLFSKARAQFYKHNDSIRTYSIKGIAQAQTNDDRRGQGLHYLMMSNYFRHSGGSPDSIKKYLDLGLHYLQDIKEDQTDQWINLSKAEYYHEIGNFDRSIQHYLRFNEISQQLGDHENHVFGLLRVGQALRHFGMFKEAIDYHCQVRDYNSIAIDPVLQQVNLDYLSFSFEDNLQLDSAYHYKNVARGISTFAYPALQYYQNADKAFIHMYNESYDSSNFYFQKTLDIVLRENNVTGIIETYGNLAMMEEQLGDNQRADSYWVEFSEHKEKNGYASLFYLPFWAKHEEKKGNLRKAYELINQHRSVQLEYANTDIANIVSNQISNYKLNDKEKQLVIANQKIQSQKTLRNYLLLALLATSLLGLYLWSFFSSQRKISKNKMLLKQNEIELSNQKILTLKKEQDLVAVQSMVQGQEKERNRIARDLHDGMGGYLSSLKMSLSKPENLKDSQALEKVVKESTETIDNAAQELRRIAQDLMPESLTRFGLIVAIEDLVEEVQLKSDIDINFSHYDVSRNLSDEFSLAIYRIIQEALNNVRKHADAHELIIQLIQHDDQLNITIEDDGKGFDQSATIYGRGINNIKARLLKYNGHLQIESKLSEGTSATITCQIPKALPNA